MQTKQTFTVENIVSKFKPCSFPAKKFPSNYMIFKDDIVVQEPEGPKEEHLKNQKVDFFQYLIFDEKYKKASFSNQNRNNLITTNTNWKSNEKDEFFDNFKGKYNQNDVEKFKRNAELSYANVVSLCILNDKLFDENSDQSNTKNVDDFFSKHIDKKPKLLTLPIQDCILRVNKNINYSEDLPLWYIYHSEADSSYGPISSKDICQMIKSDLINEDTKIRFIDTFLYKGFKSFEFFPLKEIKIDNFSEYVKINPIIFNFRYFSNELFSRSNQFNSENEFRNDRNCKLLLIFSIYSAYNNNLFFNIDFFI